MRVDLLEAYGIPAEILSIWREQFGAELLPVQRRAVKELDLFGASNLIVFSPTSSGKTFVGEMAAVKAARENTKVFYLVPQKALAAEKYRELSERYGKIGIKVVVSSRDHREHDEHIERRDFHIAVVVVEKLQALLLSRPELLDAIGLVVVDELQLITDEKRGPTLELLLTKLQAASSPPRIVGLSAVLGRADQLAEWLGAKLLVDTTRPIELRKGVLCQGVFRYREHNSAAEGQEEFPVASSDSRLELVLRAAEHFAQRGEQALVFLPDRMSTVLHAKQLASRMPSAPSGGSLAPDGTEAARALAQVLPRGVAFHNSDLSVEQRRLVEAQFRAGAIRVLFATSTLAMGMNLPVRNVILDGQRWTYLPRYERWSLEPVSKSEYENMSGRAGRLGYAQEFGRSMLVTDSSFEAQVWLEHFARAEFEEAAPTLAAGNFEQHVLDMVASSLAHTRREVSELLLASFTGRKWWREKVGKAEWLALLDQAIDTCVAGELLARSGDALHVTDLGRISASKGLEYTAVVELARWAHERRPESSSEIEVLATLSLMRWSRDIHVPLAQKERFRVNYGAELARRIREAGLGERACFRRFGDADQVLDQETARAIKRTLLLLDWIDEIEPGALERRYRIWSGAIQRVGEDFGWLVECLGAIAQACAWSPARARWLFQLADRLRFGCRDDALPLARLRIPELGRSAVRRLVDAGIRDEGALRTIPLAALAAVLKDEAAANRVCTRLGAAAPPAPSFEAAKTPPPSPSNAPRQETESVLRIDLEQRRVWYRGTPVPTRPPNHLQRQPLLALAVLVSRPNQIVSMEELADAMHALGHLARRPIAPDARELRYKILRPFKKALAQRLAPAELDRLLETVPGAGLRLNLCHVA